MILRLSLTLWLTQNKIMIHWAFLYETITFHNWFQRFYIKIQYYSFAFTIKESFFVFWSQTNSQNKVTAWIAYKRSVYKIIINTWILRVWWSLFLNMCVWLDWISGNKTISFKNLPTFCPFIEGFFKAIFSCSFPSFSL